MVQQVPSVPAADVAGDAVLLDVREQDEWDAGHVAGALHVPMGEVVGRLGEIDSVADGRRLHVVCRSGGRSAQVAQYLLGNGRDAVNVDGGMHAWEAAAREMVTDSGAPPRVG